LSSIVASRVEEEEEEEEEEDKMYFIYMLYSYCFVFCVFQSYL